jgi:hypothetical protein
MTWQPVKGHAIDAWDAVTAHSYVGARGWQLEERPAEAPKNAIGYYRKGGRHAFLIQDKRRFILAEAEKQA